MPNSDLKRLNRAELVEIILQLTKQNEEKQAQLDELNAQLADRTLRIANAGSIAEAALAVNGVFEAAQAAADQYLASVQNVRAETDADQKAQEAEERAAEAERRAAEAERHVQEAERYADETEAYAQKIMADAEAQAARILEEAKQEANALWERFRQQAEELIQARSELDGLLSSRQNQSKNA